MTYKRNFLNKTYDHNIKPTKHRTTVRTMSLTLKTEEEHIPSFDLAMPVIGGGEQLEQLLKRQCM